MTLCSQRNVSVAEKSATERESEFFDELVRSTGDFNPFAERGWKTIARRFEQWITADRPLELLDIGCGTGQSRQLYQSTSRYVGVDLSSGALEIARRKYPLDEWQAADACRLPFEPQSFDVVAFSSVLHHIPQYHLALAEAARVLRPGGQVFAFDPNLLHPAMALFRHPKSPFYLSAGVSPNERPLLPSALREAFAGAGLVELRQRGQSDIPYREVAPPLINACLSAYNIGDYLFERIGLGRWFGTFVITCGRKPFASANG